MKECAVVGFLGVTFVWALGCGATSPEPQAPTTPPAVTASASGTAAGQAAPSDSASPDVVPTDSAPGARAASKEDTRTMESITALVKEHRKAARACYEKALGETPGLKGDLVIHFTIKPNGQVKHAELNAARSTITQATVSSCVIDVIAGIQFPRSSKGMETNINYPFNFNP